jgi:DinB family protein
MTNSNWMAGEEVHMSEPVSLMILERVQKTHRRLLEIAEDLSEAQLRWSPGTRAPSIAFHIWHMARWADRLQATLPRMTALAPGSEPVRELWEAEALAQRWGWSAGTPGYGQTGMEMSDEAAADLTLPPREMLFDYARRAFDAADRAVGAIQDQQLEQRGVDIYEHENSVGYVLLVHVSHASRHLGMIECLRGVQGLHGTATV